MNDYEISQLTHEQVIAHFGQPQPTPKPNDVVLIVGGSGSHPVADPSPVNIRGFVIAGRIVEVSQDSKRAKVRNIHKYFEDGVTVPFSGEDWVDTSYFTKATQTQISEQKDLFQRF